MSRFYQDMLKPVLNKPMESVEFLTLKGMLKRTVMCPVLKAGYVSCSESWLCVLFCKLVMCPNVEANGYECCVDMVCKPYNRNKDDMACRCYNKECNCYTKYYSILVELFLSEFNAPLSSILKVCCKWFFYHTQMQIGAEVRLNRKVIIKIIDRLRNVVEDGKASILLPIIE